MTIRTETDGRIQVIAIDRPEARSAVNPETATALFDAFLAFDRNDALDVAIFASTGGSFCAGFDLKFAAEGITDAWLGRMNLPDGWDDPVGQPIEGPMGPTRLMLSKPVIGAIEGPAVAGGMELALWCDMRVMAQSSFTGVFCRRWGVPLIDGGTFRLPRLIGESRAMDLVLTGRKVEAEECLALGFANRLVPDGESFATAHAIAEALCRFPQATMNGDRASGKLSGSDMAAALHREWENIGNFAAAGVSGAARFSSGKGRGGDFSDL